MVSISGFSSLGTVLRENVSISNNLIKLPIPLTETNDNVVVNVFGKQRQITLECLYTGTESQIASFITTVMVWVNSGRQTARTYTGTFESGISVLVDDFSYNYDSNQPYVLSYTFTMVEGSTLGPITSTSFVT